MKRRAILIEAANIKGCDYIPGAEADIENYQRYLTSQVGGQWYESEIVTLRKPSWAKLHAKINEAEKEADYLFLSFSGHGYMKSPPKNSFLPLSAKDLTMLCLNDDEEISLGQINPCIRNFVIADSCREFEQLEKAAAMLESRLESFRDLYRTKARELFDEAISKGGPGQILAYSCSINETAGEDKNRGGYFSAAMMESGLALSSANNHQRAINSDEIFENAQIIVRRQAPQQNPEYEPGRRIRHFPFAVKV